MDETGLRNSYSSFGHDSFRSPIYSKYGAISDSDISFRFQLKDTIPRFVILLKYPFPYNVTDFEL